MREKFCIAKTKKKNTNNKELGPNDNYEKRDSKKREEKQQQPHRKMDKNYEQVGQKRNANGPHTHVQCSTFFIIREM